MYRTIFKPAFDFLGALCLLFLLSPVLVGIIILQMLVLRKGVFFVHPRPGLHEKIIHVIKFRTMNEKKDEEGKLLPAIQRVTAWGSFLRKTSLDELPQLVNVLKGDLSFVGPRPLEVRYLPFYNEAQKKRHSVKPGITGWAQVNGRNTISWEDKFKYDIEYVESFSFWMDMQIVFRTVWKVLAAEGVNQDADHTVLPFDQYVQLDKRNETE